MHEALSRNADQGHHGHLATSLICMSLCYIILRNRAKRHLAVRPLNWLATVTSLNKRTRFNKEPPLLSFRRTTV